MPIVSAGICDKQGSLLVSRQFVDIPLATVQDIYSSFPRLIRPDQQHTFVEDSRYRFLYLPSNQVLIAIITTPDFNIIEAQETLKLFYRVVIAVTAEGVNEKSVEKSSFDIILAIDDIISFGERESVSVEQVVDAVKMTSAREEAHVADLHKKSESAKLAFGKQTKSR